MAAPIIIPVKQFLDADGHPYAGGSLASYVTGTTTPKATYVDPGLTALNTNPVVLDAAGRCILYGDGEFRLILRDAIGNLVWDQPATTLVSAAMAPVIAAPTIADAVHLLGIDDLIAAEAAARAAADSAEQTARIAADNAEAAARAAADANLQSQIDTINATIAGLPGPGTFVQFGTATADSDGHGSVTFPAPFPFLPSVVTQLWETGYDLISSSVMATTTGFDIWFAFPLTSGVTPAGAHSFFWVAAGPPI